MAPDRIAVIGAGNMGSAIIGGILEARVFNPVDIVASEPDEARRQYVRERYGIEVMADNLRAASRARTVLLAIKPQTLPEVGPELAKAMTHRPLIISILAGVPIEKIRSLLGADLPVVRVMPNLPARVGAAASALAFGPGVSKQQKDIAKAVFQSVGATVEVEETLIDAVTALSGSGPGFVYRLMEAFQAAGEGLGLPADTARTLTEHTFFGAAKLLVEEEGSASVLREQVTSKGGTTFAGLCTMNERDVDGLIAETLRAAHARARELGRA